MGFDYYAYKGLETGDREIATHVMRNAEGVLFAFSTPYHSGKNEDMHAHHARHGDGVKDVAFRVENTRAIYDKAISRGALSV
jgi:4-hydroxyphenylpyruvate dioxygenase